MTRTDAWVHFFAAELNRQSVQTVSEAALIADLALQEFDKRFAPCERFGMLSTDIFEQRIGWKPGP